MGKRLSESGVGIGGMVAIAMVAAVLLVGPLVMGPLTPPSPPLLLFFPVVLLFVFLYLHFASK
ncbi:PREDICTED: uncharacterized protein LOC104822239 [Tarenaya hassleriana]|uniref:uncharacterized protein LOC104822239 n=1 Tax=Tarenaya hassleriana TaxID=28532 RepID=UPI00053C260E|nr:PREDICTED: uncharacterized protein LOC104822239 [Tarenaya hassleriana]